MFPTFNNNMLSYALDSLLRSNLDAMDYYTSLSVESQSELMKYSNEFKTQEELERYIIKAMKEKEDKIL